MKNAAIDFDLIDVFKAKKVRPSRKVTNTFIKEGVVGFAYLDFDVRLGPTIKYYYTTKDSTFIKRLVENPALVAELTIIGKHANEIVTERNERILIKRIIGIDDLGRDAPNYVVVETKGKKKRLAKKLIEKLSNMNGESNTKIVNRLLEESISS